MLYIFVNGGFLILYVIEMFIWIFDLLRIVKISMYFGVIYKFNKRNVVYCYWKFNDEIRMVCKYVIERNENS